jgi:hypothetical protein
MNDALDDSQLHARFLELGNGVRPSEFPCVSIFENHGYQPRIAVRLQWFFDFYVDLPIGMLLARPFA